MENIVKSETRRDFLKVSGAVAGGLALGFYLPTGPRVARADAGGGYASPNAWIRIGLDNSITIMVARSEMGQDVYTSMPILVAEELEVDINKIKVEFAPPAETSWKKLSSEIPTLAHAASDSQQMAACAMATKL